MTLGELLDLLRDVSESKRSVDTAVEKVKQTAKKTKRKLSKWQRYIKNSSNHIKFKRGPKKGRLDLKAMSKAYKRSLK